MTTKNSLTTTKKTRSDMPKKRYNVYWRWIPVKMIQEYPALKKRKSIQAQIFTWAIEDTIKETEQLADGKFRLQAVDLVYVRKTKTIDGAALEIGASRRTVQRWLNDFVRLVAHKAGYSDE